MPRTPITGTTYVCVPATGHHDVALLDARPGIEAALLVAGRARTPVGEPIDVAALPLGDVDAIVVEVRREAFGDQMVAEGTCGACATAIDIRFGLGDFLAHHRPRRPRNVKPAKDGAWRLAGRDVSFRIPTAGDVIASVPSVDPAGELARRCITGRPRRAAELALAALAPALAAEVHGACPECGAAVPLWVDVRELCLADLRFQAGVVLEEVHLLAAAYHWAEADILAMPSQRRAAYADCVRAARGAPLAAEAFG